MRAGSHTRFRARCHRNRSGCPGPRNRSGCPRQGSGPAHPSCSVSGSSGRSACPSAWCSRR